MRVDLVRALGNTYNVEILSAATAPVSAQELSDRLEIPIATCYRRINELTDADLLENYDQISSSGQRPTALYRRTADKVCVEFEDDSFSVALQERTDVKEKLDNVWQTLPAEN